MNKNVIITAPEVIKVPECDKIDVSVFLAGTIDGGDSEDWQKKVCDTVEKLQCRNVRLIVFNPRRDKWPSAEGEIERQIVWELDHLEKADVIVMFIAKGSKSPISLLELGLHARDKKVVVFCSDKFYRWDNVRITCETYGVPLVNTDTADTIVDMLKGMEDYCSPSTLINKAKKLT